MKLNRLNNWQNVPLAKLLEFVTGGDWGKDPSFKDSNFDLAYCIRGSEIKNWEEEKGTTASLRKIKKSSIATRELKDGDILVEISGGGPDQPVGRTVLIDKKVLSFEPKIPKVCTNFLRLLRPNKEINSKYLNLYLQLFYYSGEIVNYQGGSNNLRNLKFPDFVNIEIPFPGLLMQQAIVSKIEELFSELNKGIENLQTAQNQLKVYRQSILNSIATGKNCRPLESVIEKLDQGWSPKCENKYSTNNKEWAVIKTSAVQHGYFVEVENKRLPRVLKPREQHELKVGDILITRAGPRVRVGVCCLIRHVRPKLINCDKVYRIKVDRKKILPEYFELILNTPYYLGEIEKMKTGISDSGLNLTQKGFVRIEIPIPTIQQQQSIVTALEGRLSVTDKVEEIINQSLQQVEALKQSVLKRAFEGKLVKQSTVPKAELKVVKLNQVKVIPINEKEFPKVIGGITPIELHAGILSLVIEAHEKNTQYLSKLNHVKGEKIAHLVEYKLGISLGREPVKDAAGPDDYSHLKKVEHRANKAGYFKTKALTIGRTYQSQRGLNKIIEKTKVALTPIEYKEVNSLINTFLKFDMEHAEVVATLFAGWNNLLLAGETPTDDEIVNESRENWSDRKLTIDRNKFFKALAWMRQHDMIPLGKGKPVLKSNKKNKAKNKKKVK